MNKNLIKLTKVLLVAVVISLSQSAVAIDDISTKSTKENQFKDVKIMDFPVFDSIENMNSHIESLSDEEIKKEIETQKQLFERVINLSCVDADSFKIIQSYLFYSNDLDNNEQEFLDTISLMLKAYDKVLKFEGHEEKMKQVSAFYDNVEVYKLDFDYSLNNELSAWYELNYMAVNKAQISQYVACEIFKLCVEENQNKEK